MQVRSFSTAEALFIVCSLDKDAALILTEYSSDGWAQAFSQLLYLEAKKNR
jgi:hypothetical protein